jgi:hypothetical protein
MPTQILTDDEKIIIINQHVRTLEYSLYNIELDLLEAEADDTPDAALITGKTAALAEVQKKIDALNAEKTTLES